MIRRSDIPSRARGLKARFSRDGLLVELTVPARGIALELDQPRGWGLYRDGIAGEEFQDGRIQAVGPFVGGGSPRKAARGFPAWARAKLEALLQAAP